MDNDSEASAGASAKLWGGRFSEPTDRFVERFTASIGFDARLYHHDIAGSIAHARMLAHVGVLSDNEAGAIVAGLQQIRQQFDAGQLQWSEALEDVHMNIEARLIELVGEVGKRLHTGRSRNDQVATDLRLYLRDEIDALHALMTQLMAALLGLAERHSATIMPGFTHLQIAQPVTFGHHLLAWFEMLGRDRDRLAEVRARVNVMPLGSAALAGTTFPIDRAFTARELGFDAISENSLDAVSDRDFVVEFCAAASIAMMHLSRWSEELVLWSSQQFGFVDLPDRFCTGSSIMPQKKNPDVPELIRGKSGRVFGDLVGVLTMLKGQPLAYNKDNQEDKEPLFDAVDTLKDCVTAMLGMLPHLIVREDRMRDAAARGFATATDLADYLVRRGLAFRDAHEVVGRCVAFALDKGVSLDELSLDELQHFNAGIDATVFDALLPDGSVKARDHIGGTAPAQVRAAIARARARL
jgi:argininosuccinate lyase